MENWERNSPAREEFSLGLSQVWLISLGKKILFMEELRLLLIKWREFPESEDFAGRSGEFKAFLLLYLTISKSLLVSSEPQAWAESRMWRNCWLPTLRKSPGMCRTVDDVERRQWPWSCTQQLAEETEASSSSLDWWLFTASSPRQAESKCVARQAQRKHLWLPHQEPQTDESPNGSLSPFNPTGLKVLAIVFSRKDTGITNCQQDRPLPLCKLLCPNCFASPSRTFQNLPASCPIFSQTLFSSGSE